MSHKHTPNLAQSVIQPGVTHVTPTHDALPRPPTEVGTVWSPVSIVNVKCQAVR